MINLKGKCLCGDVKYSYQGLTGKIVHCHCSKCRKWHGSPFRSRMVIEKDKFKWELGKTNLSFYESSKNVKKSFCQNCGSNLVSFYTHNNKILGLPLGGVEGNLNDIEQIHIFTKYNAPWYQINDTNKQYDELPENATTIHHLLEESES